MRHSNQKPWCIIEGDSPIVATAIHHGDAVKREIEHLYALNKAERQREEDPYTGDWARISKTRVVVSQSRFEVDLNRPREKAVYVSPADAWGLKVWKETPSAALIKNSVLTYDEFYQDMHQFFSRVESRFGRFIVLDLHSYNHRRKGPDLSDSPERNPDINIGTGTMNRSQWTAVVDRFIMDLCDYDYLGRRLDVRENIKFKGGYFAQWIHEHFPQTGCALAIEVKKFFMDEWTGELYSVPFNAIMQALKMTLKGLDEELRKAGH
jgi:N-formylglutamate amidohydrolase